MNMIELIKQRALRYGKFELSNGELSHYYLYMRRVTLYGPALARIAGQIWERVDIKIDSVGGPSIGADPIVAGLIFGMELNGFFVRPTIKTHGLCNQIEGTVSGDCLLVDDVVTSGESLFRAAKLVEGVGGKIAKIISIVDRNEGGRERLQEYDYESLFNIEELLR